MNRRQLLTALFAAPIVHQVEPVRRVYSFLWDNPLVRVADPWIVPTAPAYQFHADKLDAFLKAMYTPAVIDSILRGPSPFLDIIPADQPHLFV